MQVYALTNKADYEEKHGFYRRLQNMLDKSDAQYKDHNSRQYAQIGPDRTG